jgi:hypothetical protein
MFKVRSLCVRGLYGPSGNRKVVGDEYCVWLLGVVAREGCTRVFPKVSGLAA